MVIGRTRLLPFALALTACRPGSGPVIADPPSIVPCRDGSPGTGHSDTTVIAVAGDVRRGFAIDPQSAAERFVVAHVYETLVRVDCEGQIIPGLAERWTSDSASRVWTLTIRADATFSDGTPVTPDDVLTSWRERRSIPGAALDPAALAVDYVSVDGARRISVHLRRPSPDGPRALADPAFAVHKGSMAAPNAMLGSGPYFPPGDQDVASTIAMKASAVLVPRTAGTTPVLVVRDIPSGDARDVVDGGADVIVTADRRVTEYVRLRPGFRIVVLPADRAYVLVSTLRRIDPVARDSGFDAGWAAIRSSLERDIVRMRVPQPRDGWRGTRDIAESCADDRTVPEPRRALTSAAARSRRLVYPSSDRLAGEIAQRLVALASDEGGPGGRAGLSALLPDWFERTDVPLTAAALTDAAFERALMQGNELAYVAVVPRRSLDPCRSWRRFVAAAPWARPGLPIFLADASAALLMSARAPAVMIDFANTIHVLQSSPPGGVRR